MVLLLEWAVSAELAVNQVQVPRVTDRPVVPVLLGYLLPFQLQYKTTVPLLEVAAVGVVAEALSGEE
jgi:hypothetical protein